MHAALYGDNDHDITPAEEHCITKTANYGTITTDTYHDARKLARLLKQTIKDKCRVKDMSLDEINIFLLDCYNHLRNV